MYNLIPVSWVELINKTKKKWLENGVTADHSVKMKENERRAEKVVESEGDGDSSYS